MRFYRPLNGLKALTFDLDDTLYDNGPVIVQAEDQALVYLQQCYPELTGLCSTDLWRLRVELRQQDPEIYHDVTLWRWRSIRVLLQRQGYSVVQAEVGADEVMACFALWRSRISVSPETHQILQTLAGRFPLVAITNGNADPDACGLGDYFQFVLRAGPDGRAKPYPDMYTVAARRLRIPLASILHVGDDLSTDVTGSIRSGAQACWINDRAGSLMVERKSRLLPHLEISRLASLLALL